MRGGFASCTLATTGNTYGELNGFAAGVGYDEATGLGSLNVANVVNAWCASTALLTPTVTVTPAVSASMQDQTLNVTAAVTGSGATPTGTVTLSGGGYTSSAQTLASGSYTFAVPANSLSAGADSLTVSYGGDSKYSTGTGSASVTVTASAFALAATAPAAIKPGSERTSTISLTSTTFYSGTVTLSCALTTSPPEPRILPSCSATAGSITVTAGTPSGTGTVTVTTTAATTLRCKRPRVGGWAEAESGAVLALLVFFGIPARRRGWRAMLGAVVAAGNARQSGSVRWWRRLKQWRVEAEIPGTTAGSYVFTVTGTGSDPAKTQGRLPRSPLTVN